MGPGTKLPSDLIAGLAGAESDAQFRFTAEILAALAKIDPGLVPRLSAHPLKDAIARGVSALDDLLADYRANKDENTRFAIVDAMAEIFAKEHATDGALGALQKILANTSSAKIASAAARAIAAAKDEGFLEQQRMFLASDAPSDVRISARLLGEGRYQPAAETLLLCLRPDNMAVADVVVWALGEIGDPAALPKLHGLLSDLTFTEATLEAVGKIGHTSSVIRLLPLLIEGTTAQRIAAARALYRIARANGGQLGDEGLEHGAKTALLRAVDKDDAPRVRWFAILAFSSLGGHLEPARIKQALGAKLSSTEMDAVSGFFAGRSKKK